MFEINVAIILVIVAAALVAWFLKYKASSSEKRMMLMLQCAGLDPEIATQADIKTIISEVRRHCRKCQSEDVCQRWLAGIEEGGNIFCPNAQVFEELKRASQA
jgi:hypothetical protein